MASGEGTITYQWYSNDVQQNTGGTLINGATDPTFIPPSDVVGTKYYYATGRSNCGTVPTAISGAFTVTQPSVVVSEDLDAQEICVNDTFDPISIIAGGTGTIEYQWYSNTSPVADTLGAEVIELSGEISDSFTPPLRWVHYTILLRFRVNVALTFFHPFPELLLSILSPFQP